MQQNSLSQAEKTKTMIRGKKICPFEVIKNGIDHAQQQIQLARILEVNQTDIIEQVPFLKQTCLVEYVKDHWQEFFKNASVMRDY